MALAGAAWLPLAGVLACPLLAALRWLLGVNALGARPPRALRRLPERWLAGLGATLPLRRLPALPRLLRLPLLCLLSLRRFPRGCTTTSSVLLPAGRGCPPGCSLLSTLPAPTLGAASRLGSPSAALLPGAALAEQHRQQRVRCWC